MRPLDEFLLDKVFQPVADRYADRMTCFDFAKNCATGAAVAIAARAVLGYFDGVLSGFTVAFGFFAIMAAFWLRKLAADADRTQKEGLLNPMRITLLPARVFTVIVGIPMAILFMIVDGTLPDAFFLMEMSLWTATYYFISCQKNPPAPVHAPREAFVGGA